jgi:DNA repair protein RadC
MSVGCVRELVLKYAPLPADVPRPLWRQLKVPCDSAQFFTALLASEPVEVFGVALLDGKHRVLSYYEAHRGGINETVVDPRAVFRAALLVGAAAIIVAHNHPSGDPAPSPDDRELTQRLHAAGTLIGCEVIDHVIVAEGRYYSFREGGLL